MKQVARRCNIPNPLSLTVAEILEKLKECKKECAFYQEHGKQFRWKHLNDHLRIAQEEEDKGAIIKISTIIQQEQQRSFWQKLNYFTGKKKTQSATSIQVKGKGRAILEHSTQETVEQMIFSEIHNKQYTMAGEAPICNGTLFDKFGYASNTPVSRAMLNGTYVVPHDSDTATWKLIEEIAAICCRVPKGSVSICITPAQWKQYWKIVNEETSSSESGIHFGHYTVGFRSKIILHYHAARVTVVIAHAIQLEQWSWGLSVILEKTLGVTLVTKLWAILLIEADFNATNKIIYGN